MRSASASPSAWIRAMRLRTLPLGLAGVGMGCLLALGLEGGNPKVVGWVLLTAALLQILSNFANDLGDFEKGTDNDQRIGPARSVQSGQITLKQMQWAVLVTAGLSLLSGLRLLWLAMGSHWSLPFLLFLFLGLAAIASAIKYTMGRGAYGYSGFGDVFVYLFFGLVAVCGSYWLIAQHWEWYMLLPAMAVGSLATGVLNLNNMRDMENDLASRKTTLAVRLGLTAAKSYHAFLLVQAVVTLILFNLLVGEGLTRFLWTPLIGWIWWQGYKVSRVDQHKDFDPWLKPLALSTALISLVFGLSYWLL